MGKARLADLSAWAKSPARHKGVLTPVFAGYGPTGQVPTGDFAHTTIRSMLQADAEQPYSCDIVGKRKVGAQPFLAEFAFELKVAGSHVSKPDGYGIAIVVSHRWDIFIARPGKSHNADKPAPKGVIHLYANRAR